MSNEAGCFSFRAFLSNLNKLNKNSDTGKKSSADLSSLDPIFFGKKSTHKHAF